jgi:hypothetical protein
VVHPADWLRAQEHHHVQPHEHDEPSANKPRRELLHRHTRQHPLEHAPERVQVCQPHERAPADMVEIVHGFVADAKQPPGRLAINWLFLRAHRSTHQAMAAATGVELTTTKPSVDDIVLDGDVVE